MCTGSGMIVAVFEGTRFIATRLCLDDVEAAEFMEVAGDAGYRCLLVGGDLVADLEVLPDAGRRAS